MGTPAHILLVDDDEGFRYAAETALRRAGFEVTSVPDYRGALESLEGNASIDLLITDVVMPDRINGFALARMARMRRLNLKVLYLTGYEVPTNEAIGKVLLKPITPDHLTDEVRLALAP